MCVASLSYYVEQLFGCVIIIPNVGCCGYFAWTDIWLL